LYSRGCGLPSLRFKVEAKKVKGNAPIPKEKWRPPSPPKPNPGKF